MIRSVAHFFRKSPKNILNAKRVGKEFFVYRELFLQSNDCISLASALRNNERVRYVDHSSNECSWTGYKTKLQYFANFCDQPDSDSFLFAEGSGEYSSLM